MAAEFGPEGVIPGVRVLEHTADVGIEAEGGSLAECLARLGAGLFALMFVPPAVDPQREIEVELDAPDPEELSVAWLEELLYRSEVDGVCCVRFEVETDGRRLRGRARGIAIAAGVEAAGPPVKAVTRHGLKVRRRDAGWLARVLVDV